MVQWIFGSDGSRFCRFGGVLVAASGLLAGCRESKSNGGSDAGPDAAVDFVSAQPRGDAGGGAIVGTQDLTVGLDTRESVGELTVGLDSLGAEAGVTESGIDAGSHHPSTWTTSEASLATTTIEATTPESSSIDGSTSAPPMTTSSEPTSTNAVETSVPPVVSTESPPSSDADASPPSSDADASTSVPPIVAGVSTDASWVDLPATFRAIDLPDLDLSFTWSVVAVPAGSLITSESLVGSTSSTATFTPDVAGAYTLRLHLASGETSSDVEATVSVAKVDVGFLVVADGGDGYYYSDPRMVPSDQSAVDVSIGCYVNSWEFDDSTNWITALPGETEAIGFHYPTQPGADTLFAYHYRDSEVGSVTHVASAGSDCANNRPVDLQFGYQPEFSPSGKQLLRQERREPGYLLSTPIDANVITWPISSGAVATDWENEDSIVWSGYSYVGAEYAIVVASTPNVTDGTFVTLLECRDSDANTRLFNQIDDVAVVPGEPGGLLVLSDGALWFLPWSATGSRVASCDGADLANILIAGAVADFELAPDGKTLALITAQYNQDLPVAFLGVGPVDEPFDTESPAWQATEIASFNGFNHAFTGIRWIAGAQQLVWTTVQYEAWDSDGYYFFDINSSSVQKINADGSHRRQLAYKEHTDSSIPNSVVTTGPLAFQAGYWGGYPEGYPLGY